ncbi:flagellar filament capping protein FliD [Paenibacillus antarcticus]|uniref:Flagellar hook-associated protein 2 n=1 Tax=Paenibacillus antarcticus TaxID=253703 RepID=A0A168KD09_9BACL|nr:flagellar filament capping protein FliD [Paenibacillus antarcticus]OAB41850.1 flagellar capping protein [Paenibacillus antarcticus]
MRINGFSGMDVDSMVSQLMTAKRAPLNKLNQQKTILQWTRDSYRELNSKIVDFKDNKLKSYKLSAGMNTQQAVLTGNTTAVKAEATADANGTAMSIEVVSLAKKSNIQSEALTTGDTKTAQLSTKLEDLGGEITASNFDLVINGKLLSLSKDDTIASAIRKINSLPNANVIAAFDEVSGKFSVISKEYGKDITVDTSNFNAFSFGGVETAKQAVVNVKVNPLDPSNTSTKTFYSDSNSLTVNGIQLSLLATNTAANPVNITTTTDSTKALDTIKAFVDNYNDFINTFSTKVNEEKYRTYQPLTNEEKKEMKDSDVIAWEAKAKSGLLKNDEILKATTSSMRSAIMEQLKELSSVGITTGQYYENGKIYINEEKLKAALQSDPQKVTNIFKGTTDGSTKGIFEKIGNTMDEALTKMVTKAGTSKYSSDINSVYKEESVMGRKLKDYNKRISSLEVRLVDMETRYYKQFTAMEKAMNKYQSQSSSLTNYSQ